MFSTICNKSFAYRQLSLTPKYYYGEDKIVILTNNALTQEEVFIASVYKIETGAKEVVSYNQTLDIEFKPPTEDVCSIIEHFYKAPESQTILLHSNNFFVALKYLHANVIIVEVAGDNYQHLNSNLFTETIDVNDMMNEGIDSVKSLVEFVEKYVQRDSLKN